MAAKKRTMRPAAHVLAELLPPDLGCPRSTYKKYVAAHLASDRVSVEALRDLCSVYQCDASRVVDKIVDDKGKGLFKGK